MLDKRRTKLEHVKEYTSKIGADLRVRSAILDIVETNESQDAHNCACRDLRALFREFLGLPPERIAQILASDIAPSTPKTGGPPPTLIAEIYKSSNLICEHVSTLQT